MATLFNFDAAMQTLKDDPIAVQFLTLNRARLEQMGTDAGIIILREVLALFAQKQNAAAWKAFYETGDWATIGAGAAEDVTNTSGMADRAKAVGDWIDAASAFALKALLSILVAGFCG